jgi:hypothetical protein
MDPTMTPHPHHHGARHEAATPPAARTGTGHGSHGEHGGHDKHTGHDPEIFRRKCAQRPTAAPGTTAPRNTVDRVPARQWPAPTAPATALSLRYTRCQCGRSAAPVPVAPVLIVPLDRFTPALTHPNARF